ncbi:MAG: hypothetical protein KC729_19765, partial [Candidatus Eisenbacteria bacterium]|nr:hypothetical protein [Candidatus Eisenbacteria bacterium]
MALLGIGCHEREPALPETPVRSGGCLRVLQERANDLDPVLIDDIYEGTVANQVYEGLVKASPNLAIVPSLAESWVISEDGLRYRFRLRRGVRFHDGQELTAEAVVSSLTRVLSPNKPKECLAESYLGHIEGAQDFQEGRAESVRGLLALDPLTVEIVLDTPVSFFLAVLAMDQLRIVPPSPDTDANLRDHPMGTGPFRFGGRMADGSVVLLRNDQYWGKTALLDSLVLVCGDDVSKDERVTMLTAGVVDVAWVDADHREVLERDNGFDLTYAPELSVSFLGLNCELAPLDDVRVRRAIAHCIDRRTFRSPDFDDVIVAAGVLPPGMPGYLPEPRVPAYDVSRAEALIAQAGYGASHPCPPIDLYVSSSGTLRKWIE